METNQVTTASQNKPVTINSLLGKDAIKKKFEEILKDKAPAFISSVISATKANPMLAQCDPQSVVSSAVVAATLDLPIQNNLGFAAIVPYNESYQDGNGNWQKRSVAQFQMMWRGFVQLAWRSGQYQTINAAPIFAGELVKYNRITGEVIIDEAKRTSDEVIGYCAYFKLINGAEKYLYMNVGEVRAHGEKFSKSFKNKSSMWQKDFNAMALKTVLKMLLSKYGILSVEMQKSLAYDQAVVTDMEQENVSFPDNTETVEATVVHDVEATVEETSTENPSQSSLPTPNDL
jgi:recombination protein RecT